MLEAAAVITTKFTMWAAAGIPINWKTFTNGLAVTSAPGLDLVPRHDPDQHEH